MLFIVIGFVNFHALAFRKGQHGAALRPRADVIDLQVVERCGSFMGVEADARVTFQGEHTVRVHDASISHEHFYAGAVNEDPQ